MTDEEINRKFDVVAGHLATLAVGLQQLQEAQTRTEGGIRALLAAAEIQAGEIKDLSESVKDLGESVRAINGRQKQTDERLDALINTVERYISERRDGKK